LEEKYDVVKDLNISKLSGEEIAMVENLFIRTAESLCVPAGPQVSGNFPNWGSFGRAKKEVKARIFKYTPEKYRIEIQKFWNEKWPDAADDS
jgi:hypothetical protein